MTGWAIYFFIGAGLVVAFKETNTLKAVILGVGAPALILQWLHQNPAQTSVSNWNPIVSAAFAQNVIDLDDLAGRVITFTLEKPTDLDRYTIKIFDLDGGLIHAEDWAGAADPTARVTVPEGAAAIEIEGLYANPFTFQFGADGNLTFQSKPRRIISTLSDAR